MFINFLHCQNNDTIYELMLNKLIVINGRINQIRKLNMPYQSLEILGDSITVFKFFKYFSK